MKLFLLLIISITYISQSTGEDLLLSIERNEVCSQVCQVSVEVPMNGKRLSLLESKRKRRKCRKRPRCKCRNTPPCKKPTTKHTTRRTTTETETEPTTKKQQWPTVPSIPTNLPCTIFGMGCTKPTTGYAPTTVNDGGVEPTTGIATTE
jgi:hypothetical protein